MGSSHRLPAGPARHLHQGADRCAVTCAAHQGAGSRPPGTAGAAGSSCPQGEGRLALWCAPKCTGSMSLWGCEVWGSHMAVCTSVRNLCAAVAGGGCRGAQGCRDQGSCQAAPHTAAVTSAGHQGKGTPRGSALPRRVCSTAWCICIGHRLCTAPCTSRLLTVHSTGIGWYSTALTTAHLAASARRRAQDCLACATA